MMSKTTNKFSPEVRERAVRLALDTEGQHKSRWQAVMSIAAKIGYTAQTLNEWVKKAQIDSGRRAGIPSEIAETMKALERETRLLCSTKPSKVGGVGISAARSAAQASAIVPGSMPCGRRAHCSMQRSSSQAFIAARSGKVRHQLKDLVPGILHVLLDLPFLPARCRVAELRLEDVVAGHRQEPRVDPPDLAPADPVNGGLHVFVDAPP